MDIPVDQAVRRLTLFTAPAWPAHPAWLAQFLMYCCKSDSLKFDDLIWQVLTIVHETVSVKSA